MNLLKRNNDSFLTNVFNNKYFDDFFNFDMNPRTNIKENEKEYNIEIAVPGLNNENKIKAKINKNKLTIYSEQKEEVEKVEENYYYREFNYNKFNKIIQLPDNIEKDSIKFNYENGILNVNIPKSKEGMDKEIEIDIN